MRELKFADQTYKIAERLNSGVVVAETVLSDDLAAQGGSVLATLTGGLLGNKPRQTVQRMRTLYLPHMKEGVIRVQAVEILGEDQIRFCNITGIQPGTPFEGTEERTYYSNNVRVRSEIRVRGFKPGTVLNAVMRFQGDGKQSEAVLQELLPIK